MAANIMVLKQSSPGANYQKVAMRLIHSPISFTREIKVNLSAPNGSLETNCAISKAEEGQK